MYHSIAQPLPWGSESVGYFSVAPPDRLLVFVHGFGGNSTRTWAGLDKALTSETKAAATDIVFFGYPSLRAQPENSAGLLRGFLDDAAGHQRRWKQIASRVGQADRVYPEVLVVAHSLGAPVARRAILDGLRSGALWPQLARIVLFAPAHLGAYPLKLQQELGGGVGALISTLLAFAKIQILSLDGLQPGSNFLTTLLEDSRAEHAKGHEEPVTARQVVMGVHDGVVKAGNFFRDPPPDVWAGHGHCSVCRDRQTPATVIRHL